MSYVHGGAMHCALKRDGREDFENNFHGVLWLAEETSMFQLIQILHNVQVCMKY